MQQGMTEQQQRFFEILTLAADLHAENSGEFDHAIGDYQDAVLCLLKIVDPLALDRIEIELAGDLTDWAEAAASYAAQNTDVVDPAINPVIAARKRGVCRICGEPATDQMTYDFGNEYAHTSCLKSDAP